MFADLNEYLYVNFQRYDEIIGGSCLTINLVFTQMISNQTARRNDFVDDAALNNEISKNENNDNNHNYWYPEYYPCPGVFFPFTKRTHQMHKEIFDIILEIPFFHKLGFYAVGHGVFLTDHFGTSSVNHWYVLDFLCVFRNKYCFWEEGVFFDLEFACGNCMLKCVC